MSDASVWTVLESIGTVAGAFLTLVAVGISLFLLRQGQFDRRSLRMEEVRRQASKVTLTAGPGAMATFDRQLGGLTSTSYVVTVYNESDQLITVTGIRFFRTVSWDVLQAEGKTYPDEGYVHVTNPLLRPSDHRQFAVPDDWSPETGVGGDFAVVEFRDAAGRGWRRRSDDFRLEPLTREISPGQQRFQNLCLRHPIVHKLLVDPAIALAISAARRGSDRIPLSVRYIRRVWGYWGAGEKDAWQIPDGAPALYPFDELFPRPPKGLSRRERRRLARGQGEPPTR